MSDKAKWWAGVAAGLAPIAVVAAMWPSFEPALDWFMKTSLLILERPVVQAVLVSMGIGVLLAGFLPHLHLLDNWPPSRTRAVTRGLCIAVTFAACYVLLSPVDSQQQAYALVYATLSGLASSAVWTTISNLLYRVAPKPESLK